MPANQFGRYVWLVDTFRHYKHLSYKEVSEKWQQSGLSYGEGDELPLRTFHNHRKAIIDIFWIIDKENIYSAKPEFTDSVLLDKIQIPYWRAHPEVSITSYESRIQIHWNGAYAKSLW